MAVVTCVQQRLREAEARKKETHVSSPSFAVLLALCCPLSAYAVATQCPVLAYGRPVPFGVYSIAVLVVQ
eukprot:2197504-Rhodomonas_salina.1